MTEARLDPFGDVARETRMLARRDKALAKALKAIGAPHIRRRPGGFEALFRIIVEQQVSVPSAQAIWKRCNEGVDVCDCAAVRALGVDGLRALGLSTPKARYVEALAASVAQGTFSFESLTEADDGEAHERLVALKGVGPWTAAIYLLFCEGRVDIWPPGDVALQYAYGAASGMDGKIDGKILDARAEGWAPWRGLAAHILWTYYAHLRGRTPI
ncbi:MAG: DNA-3-methyladenine glycosylase 2 family protein [Pseudomonadota bacterium]|nr:DNA-3-methyladenine glycosylase 2 family protein [Pseudomonadota bacterium]